MAAQGRRGPRSWLQILRGAPTVPPRHVSPRPRDLGFPVVVPPNIFPFKAALFFTCIKMLGKGEGVWQHVTLTPPPPRTQIQEHALLLVNASSTSPSPQITPPHHRCPVPQSPLNLWEHCPSWITLPIMD